jgi:hypothetical protein
VTGRETRREIEAEVATVMPEPLTESAKREAEQIASYVQARAHELAETIGLRDAARAAVKICGAILMREIAAGKHRARRA